MIPLERQNVLLPTRKNITKENCPHFGREQKFVKRSVHKTKLNVGIDGLSRLSASRLQINGDGDK